MSITTDFHVHTAFSGDSDAPMEEMIQQAIKKGLTHLCFTEHLDYDYVPDPSDPEVDFSLDTPNYQSTFLQLKEKYQSKIHLGFGVELGLQPHLKNAYTDYLKAFDFDFVIGSTHVVKGIDPYYPSYYVDKTEIEVYESYFQEVYENVKAFSDFDVCGHLDYIVRYGQNKDKFYNAKDYRELWDAILKIILDNGKGIEINTGGIRKGLQDTHPCTWIVNRYKELGGEIITIGSDAHKKEDLVADFAKAAQVLQNCGFSYYTVFSKRKPEFIKL